MYLDLHFQPIYLLPTSVNEYHEILRFSVQYALEYNGATLTTYQKINEGGEHM